MLYKTTKRMSIDVGASEKQQWLRKRRVGRQLVRLSPVQDAPREIRPGLAHAVFADRRKAAVAPSRPPSQMAC